MFLHFVACWSSEEDVISPTLLPSTGLWRGLWTLTDPVSFWDSSLLAGLGHSGPTEPFWASAFYF